jgi:hypothetical protein
MSSSTRKPEIKGSDLAGWPEISFGIAFAGLDFVAA